GLFKKPRNMSSVVQFLQEARGELAKVVWPSQKQVARYTLIVVLATLVLAAYLGGLDYVFSSLVKGLIIR
ncbi:MAG: preprotein translocase subunit SecE, partial [Nitrososphaera sp.]|nr:preprotein translocase subunit SecE [Nitrososphaera sp.]